MINIEYNEIYTVVFKELRSLCNAFSTISLKKAWYIFESKFLLKDTNTVNNKRIERTSPNKKRCGFSVEVRVGTTTISFLILFSVVFVVVVLETFISKGLSETVRFVRLFIEVLLLSVGTDRPISKGLFSLCAKLEREAKSKKKKKTISKIYLKYCFLCINPIMFLSFFK
jgi:hypothetical protein